MGTLNMQQATTSISAVQIVHNIEKRRLFIEKPQSQAHVTNMKDAPIYKTRPAVPQRAQNQDRTPLLQGEPVKEVKIILAGNVGSGKSTAIRAISEIPVMGSDAKATERDALHHKESTTVSMEYGMAHLDNSNLHIYSTPGQRRFDFMVDVLCKNAQGMVVMIDNGCRDPLNEMDYYLHQHSHFLQNYPGIIAITHFDDNNTDTSLLDYRTYLLKHGLACPVVSLDARNTLEVKQVLMKLLLQISKFKTEK
jgi:hypothetical protein